jgi:hypothetical protein
MQEHLRHLRLHRIRSLLESSLDEAAQSSLSYSDFLYALLTQSARPTWPSPLGVKAVT